MLQTTNKFKNGFSMIEILLVISLLAVILAISAPSLVNPLSTETVDTTAKDIVDLLKDAQAKAVNGETFGQIGSGSFSLHFQSNSYTLFKGTIYNPADTNNFLINVPSGLTLTTDLTCVSAPNDCNNIVFTQITGEVANFDPANNSVCLKKTSGGSSSILISTNRWGIVNAQATTC